MKSIELTIDWNKLVNENGISVLQKETQSRQFDMTFTIVSAVIGVPVCIYTLKHSFFDQFSTFIYLYFADL